MRRWCLLLFTLVAAAAAAETVWKWVDQNGQIHYSDRPVPGAEQIELQGAQSFPSTPLRSPPPTANRADRPGQQRAALRAYRDFDVLSPAQQETLWNIGATLEVSVALDPPLQEGHRLDVYLDGQLREIGATAAQFTVPEVYRGTHRLQVVVHDARGTEVLRSQIVTFVVQQTSILNPNNPNAPGRRN